MHQSWLNGLTSAASPDELPLLAQTPSELQPLLDDDLSPLRKLADCVMSDPALALRVLQEANAVPHKYFRFELSSLEDAIHMLGTRLLGRMAQDAATSGSVLDEGRDRLYRQVCGRAALSALLALDWAELDRDRFPAQISLAALLNSLGELYLIAHGDARMGRYLDVVERCYAYPHEAEYVTLGLSLEALGHQLARDWDLPEIVRESMQARNAQHLRTLCVMLATQTARYALTGWTHPMQRADLSLVAELLDQDIAALRNRINRVLARLNTRIDRYALRPIPPLPALARDGPPGKPAPLGQASFCLAPRSDDLHVARTRLTADGDASAESLFRALLEGLYSGLGLNRAVIALYDSRRARLTAEYVIGTDFEPRFNRFQLELEEAGVFASLLSARHDLWWRAGERAADQDEMPTRIRSLIGVDAFFATGLWAAGRPLGLLYADRRSEGCALDARSYAGFLELARLLERRLERLSSA